MFTKPLKEGISSMILKISVQSYLNIDLNKTLQGSDFQFSTLTLRCFVKPGPDLGSGTEERTSTLVPVASRKVPSAWMSGCWMFTRIPGSNRLELHTKHSTRTEFICLLCVPVCSQMVHHLPGALSVGDEGWCGYERATQVLSYVYLVCGGGTVGWLLAGQVDRLPFTLHC